MKKNIVACLAISFAASLFGQEEDYSSKSLWDFHPIHAGGNIIAFGKADVDPKKGELGGQLLYNKANVFTTALLPISKTSFFFPRFEWNFFTMNWDENPKFRETHFQFFQFALTFYSIAVESWRWIARGEYNIDVKHFSHPKTYGLFSALIWGKHELNCRWFYHVGAVGYTGFEGEMVYPIIGIDYVPNKTWLFSAVFPITYSIEYAINKEWRLAIKGRPLKERFRTGPDEPQPRSVFSYSAIGAEFNVHYEKFLRCEAEAYVGYNFGGDFYIKNKSGDNSYYTDLKGAPYVGASFNWGF